MTFNEFQRELRARGIDEPHAYMFTLIYERLVHMSKEIDNNAKATLALANSLASFVTLHESTQNMVKELYANRDDARVESE